MGFDGITVETRKDRTCKATDVYVEASATHVDGQFQQRFTINLSISFANVRVHKESYGIRIDNACQPNNIHSVANFDQFCQSASSGVTFPSSTCSHFARQLAMVCLFCPQPLAARSVPWRMVSAKPYHF